MREPAANLTIGHLAQLTGMSAKVIRYYESIGLLPQPSRGANRYRRYGIADVNRVHLLRRIRLLGVPLHDAKALVLSASSAACAEVQTGLLQLIDRRLQAIEQEIADLHLLRNQMMGYQHTLVARQPITTTAFGACGDMRCIGVPISEEEKTYESICPS